MISSIMWWSSVVVLSFQLNSWYLGVFLMYMYLCFVVQGLGFGFVAVFLCLGFVVV